MKIFRRALLKTLMIVFFTIFGVIAGTLLLEIYLNIMPPKTRFAFTRQQAQMFDSDPEVLLHLKPNLNMYISSHTEFAHHVRTNSDGLRDEPLDGAADIVAIGDSFTFGYGVEQEQGWPARLQAISSQRVANLGFAGRSSYVYPATIRRHAVPLNARVWIWAFFINDLLESAGAQDFIESGQQDFKSTVFPPQPFPRNTQVWNILAPRFNPEYSWQASSTQGFATYHRGPLYIHLTGYGWERTDPANPDVERGWELTEAALAEGQRLAAEHNVSLVLVNIPTREHVYWPLIQDEMTGFDVARLDAATERLSRVAAAHDIPFLDLLPGIQVVALQEQMLYFPSDGHWNSEGQDLAAWLIYDRLIQEGLLPT